MDEWSLLLKCLHAHLLFHTGGSQCFNLGLCDFFVDLYPKHNFVTRQQMEGQSVFSIDQSYFKWT
jgi:hypothetical protein